MRAPERMEALTGLRAFAALAVVFFHFRFVGFAPVGYAAHYPITGSLYLGVDLFFILSGFVLMHAHGAEFGRIEPGTALRFYALRLARIYPVHLAILFLVLAMLGGELVLSHGAPLGPEQAERFRPDGFFRHLFLVGWSSPTWNPPAWSLSAEWTAYLFFPLVAWAAVRLSIPAALAVLGALAVTFATVYATEFEHVLDRHGLVRIAFEFPAGCLLYRLRPVLGEPAKLALVGAGLALAASLFGTRWGDLAALPLLAALIVACSGRNLLSRPLAAPALVWLGEVSYAIYMIHVVALTLLGRAAPRVLAAFPAAGRPLMLGVSLLVIVALAAALHYAIERPVRDWARRRLTGAVVRPPAPWAPPVAPNQG